jgi:membrane-bound metal-dependent hydrolase YbcI (DUF457 family)
MIGRSHLLVGLTAGIVLDSVTHLTGAPLTSGQPITIENLAIKAVYYFAVGFGALLPDIDNARSTLGHKLGKLSEFIQKTAGHRTVFHSFLGLLIGSLLALGLEQLISALLDARGLAPSAGLVKNWHVFFFGTLFGCIMHLVCDGLTHSGVPLLWPMKIRFGFPPKASWRFRTGTWIENVVVISFMLLVAIGIWYRFVVV